MWSWRGWVHLLIHWVGSGLCWGHNQILVTPRLEYFQGDISTFLLAPTVISTLMRFQSSYCALEPRHQLSKSWASPFLLSNQQASFGKSSFPHLCPQLCAPHVSFSPSASPQLSACSCGHSVRAWGALKTFLLVPCPAPRCWWPLPCTQWKSADLWARCLRQGPAYTLQHASSHRSSSAL